MPVLHGDCLALMADMPEGSVDAVVTDPPYGLGFMGKAWDDLPPGLEWAEACLRVLKPGGHLLAFGGTRTWHRLACAVEDAGFEVRDSIAWLYGSGFPKSHNLSGEWEGWGTALKPAFEPVVVARKPLVGTVAANVCEHGTGALNIDGCRVEHASEADRRRNDVAAPGLRDSRSEFGGGLRVGTNPSGRWPANVVLDEAAAAALDEQSGQAAPKAQRSGLRGGSEWHGKANFGSPDQEVTWPADPGGGASRFFYVAKAPKKERPRTDTTVHPTVKPLTLMRWLVRLVTPPCGTVLDPFAGSGTTAEACLLEGFDCIAIEREADYLPLIEQRLARHDSTLFLEVS